jgi:carbon storage regulator CsrA
MIDGGKVVVTVLSIQGGRVKLGVEAPAEVSIKRKETGEAIQEEPKQ